MGKVIEINKDEKRELELTLEYGKRYLDREARGAHEGELKEEIIRRIRIHEDIIKKVRSK